MIEQDWPRNYVNRQVETVRRMFKWAAGDELLPASIYQALKTVEGLRKGKSRARETKKILPVSQVQVDATLPHLSPLVQALVRFELLTGCRPAEVCMVRPIDIDMGNPACWV